MRQPRAKIEGSKRLLSGTIYDHGSTLTTGRTLQGIRRYYDHWGTEKPTCHSPARPADVLLGFLDQWEIWAQWTSTEICVAFWHTVAWVRGKMESGDVWGNLSR